jgi:hypothetical protein
VYDCAVRLVTQLLRPSADLGTLVAAPGLLPSLVNVLNASLFEPAWLPGLLNTAELLKVSRHIFDAMVCCASFGMARKHQFEGPSSPVRSLMHFCYPTCVCKRRY